MNCSIQAIAFRSSKEATRDEKKKWCVEEKKNFWVLQCVKQEKKYLKKIFLVLLENEKKI